MGYDHINRGTYERKRLVERYTYLPLQIAEVMFLVKYRDEYVDKNVLDIGCGAGRTTAYMRHWAKDYTCIDYSEGMTDHCKRRFDGIRCLCCDVRDMSAFRDQEFDFVLFANNGLDSLDHDDRIKGLLEVRRVLKDGGIFIFSSHNRSYRHCRSEPKLEFALDPAAMFRKVTLHRRRCRNRQKNRIFERDEEKFSIINDSSHLYSLITYYVDQRTQAEQLREQDFEPMEVYDWAGNSLGLHGDDQESSWLYYVARKLGQNGRAATP